MSIVIELVSPLKALTAFIGIVVIFWMMNRDKYSLATITFFAFILLLLNME